MRFLRLLIIPILFILGCAPQGEDLEALKARFQTQIEFLASDALEGRETGQPGEKKAAEYLINEFLNIGLEPKGDEDFIQTFEFLSGKSFGENNSLQLGEMSLERIDDYFPMNFSGNGSVEAEVINVGFGIQAEELNFDDYAGKDVGSKIVLVDVSSPDGIHPHSKYAAYHDLRNRVKKAEELGAIGVILYNPGDLASDPKPAYANKMAKVTIPVVFVKDPENAMNLSKGRINIEMEDAYSQGSNVVGFINNQKERTVILGAHFDHLGYGDEGSLYRGEERAVHNGADDNASGTALILELARHYSQIKNPNSNYLFIAFSGEEKGLLGSNHFAKNPSIDLEQVNYMINLDMVGRLDSNRSVIISGVGTSPVFDSLVDGNLAGDLTIIEKMDGIGPSDHTSFYLQDIPVLALFTGAHEDYHKPSDDAELINYDGMVDIYSYLIRIMDYLDTQDKLEFTKTKDSENEKAPRFSVTLGVVPDYAYSGTGMRIDGVTQGKPASKAGLVKGDVVVQLGEHEVEDMMGYMNALSKFKKGDKTTVQVQREKEILKFEIKF